MIHRPPEPPPPARAVPEAHATLGHLLRRPYEQLLERVYGRLAAHGHPDVRPAHSVVFRHILPTGSRIVDLAERAHMTKQSMAYLVQSLEDLGYVEIGPDPSDGRAKLVRPTERGHAVWALLVGLSAEIEQRAAERIGRVRIAELRESLALLAAAIADDAADR